jgi:hypothetical protein
MSTPNFKPIKVASRRWFFGVTPQLGPTLSWINPAKSAYRKHLPGNPELALPLCRKPALSRAEPMADLLILQPAVSLIPNPCSRLHNFTVSLFYFQNLSHLQNTLRT